MMKSVGEVRLLTVRHGKWRFVIKDCRPVGQVVNCLRYNPIVSRLVRDQLAIPEHSPDPAFVFGR